MTEPAPGPLLAGQITVTATATVTHPDGADLSELPVIETGTENTETNR
jgi:hypothetical protein